ncbi:secreted RxLR effector protein 161-like [Nicotiana tabacum]|uniref:Secreted RxLR effector protein 161-like n=1 Tax=Nicotiana tabacum TaxID=4097 RepID=A0AC58S7T7_TOBAC
MGELNFFLGLQVKQTPKDTMISQHKYIKELLKRFEMESSKIIDTLIVSATHLDMDEPGSPVNETMYRGIIGSLLYLTASRTDIIFSVGLCDKFQSSQKESHLKAAKRILRYLKGTQDLILYYPLGDNFDLIGYVDVDYAGYLVYRKSTSGMAHLLGSCLISWGTRKQNFVALSTVEA